MANLYNKAGLINIPVGYSDGFLYNIKPTDNTLGFKFDRASAATRVNEKGLIEQVGYFGPELVQNGDFDTNSDWHLRFVVIEDGVAKFQENNSSYSRVRQNTGFIGQAKVTYTISFNNSSNTTIQLRSHGGAWFGNVPATVGTHTVYNNFTDAAVSFQTGVLAAGEEIHLDNVSVTEVLGDKPRIDYTDSLTSPSFLLEPQSTNLLPYSEDFSQSSYIKDSGITVGTQDNISPGVIANATRIDVTNSGRIYSNVTSSTYYFTVFIKAGTFSYFKLAGKQVDLVAETIVGGSIKSYANGWYRVGYTYTGNRPFQVQAYPDNTYTAHTASGNYYIWGAQAEALSYATSYIPTTGSTVTRAAETCNGAGNASTFNDSEGVLYAEISGFKDDPTNRYISISDGTNENSVSIIIGGNNFLYVTIRSNNATQYSRFYAPSNGFIAENNNKIALHYKQNDIFAYLNGNKILAETTGNSPIGLNTLNFDRVNGFDGFYGKVKGVYAFNKALTDDELQQLTS